MHTLDPSTAMMGWTPGVMLAKLKTKSKFAAVMKLGARIWKGLIHEIVVMDFCR